MKLHRPPFRALCRRTHSPSLGLATRTTASRQLPLCATFQRPALSQRASPCQFARNYASVSAADLQFGQPVHETHPHILRAGELTPGITAQEYADRRAALAHSLTDGSVAILYAAPLAYKSGAVFHQYRQDSNFLYLTGWNEPDAVAIIRKTGPTLGDYVFTMFVKPKDTREEQWNGYCNGVQAAEDIFNADEAYSIASVDSMMPGILESARLVYTDASQNTPSRGLLGFLNGNSTKPNKTPLYPVVNKLRVIKSDAEVMNMRVAGQVSGRAITDAMRRPWEREKGLHAFLDYEFTKNGCDGPAYIPVIAGGQRANCIHYTVNNQVLNQDEFVLVDAGGEYGTYITDISRTWPLSGRFTPAQRDLYTAVLNVQRTSVALCRASSNMSLEDIHNATVRGLVDQLKSIGFSSISMSNIGELFPHHVGHYVGLDVHDCPGFSRREKLVRGHCVTIEPGVYVPDDVKWPKAFRGMGVRIEDSVCVDDEEPYVLTTEAVKEVDDIEALR